MKNKKLIIGIGAAAVVIVAAIIISLCFGLGDKEEVIKGNVYEEMGEITSITYTDGKEEVTVLKKKGKWIWKHDSKLPLDQDVINFEVERVSEFVTIDMIDEPGSMKEYGLDKPIYSITFKAANGKSRTIHVGNTYGEEMYYVTTGAKKDVYIVPSDILFLIDSLQIQKSISEDESLMYGTENEY